MWQYILSEFVVLPSKHHWDSALWNPMAVFNGMYWIFCTGIGSSYIQSNGICNNGKMAQCHKYIRYLVETITTVVLCPIILGKFHFSFYSMSMWAYLCILLKTFCGDIQYICNAGQFSMWQTFDRIYKPQ